MSRILLRSGKGPFTPVGAETTLAQDVFNSNSGNYLFQHAVWRALAVPGSEIVSNGTLSERRRPKPGDAERIDEEFDVFVVPLANAFRPSFAPKLDLLSELIERLTIPVVVVGVGAQSSASYDTERLATVADSTRRFVRAVLERSASIGVRGEFTLDYLTSLGFDAGAIDVIGCPSLFLYGPQHRVRQVSGELDAEASLAISLSPGAAQHGAGAWASRQAERYRRATYVLQNRQDLQLLLWGLAGEPGDPEVPDHPEHPLYTNDRMRLFLDLWTWIDFLARQDFCVGTRFHGNVAGLLAGTPSFILAHDSRTRELAEYHRIPHRMADPVDPSWDAAELYAEADMGPFNAAMPETFATYTAFLERNGLAHVWQPGQDDGGAFFDRVRATSFPPAVHSLADPREVAARLRWLQRSIPYDGNTHPDAMAYEFAHPPRNYPATEAKVRLKKRFAAQRERIEALEKRIAQLEAGLAAREATPWRRLRRRLSP